MQAFREGVARIKAKIHIFVLARAIGPYVFCTEHPIASFVYAFLLVKNPILGAIVILLTKGRLPEVEATPLNLDTDEGFESYSNPPEVPLSGDNKNTSDALQSET